MCAVCYVVRKPLMFKISGDCPASCDRGTNNPVTGVTYMGSKDVDATAVQSIKADHSHAGYARANGAFQRL